MLEPQPALWMKEGPNKAPGQSLLTRPLAVRALAGIQAPSRNLHGQTGKKRPRRYGALRGHLMPRMENKHKENGSLLVVFIYIYIRNYIYIYIERIASGIRLNDRTSASGGKLSHGHSQKKDLAKTPS